MFFYPILFAASVDLLIGTTALFVWSWRQKLESIRYSGALAIAGAVASMAGFGSVAVIAGSRVFT